VTLIRNERRLHTFSAYVIVTVLAAAANFYAATNDFVRVEWVCANRKRLGIPDSWLFPLGALKPAGAIGILVGIGVPLIGVATAAGLVLFFVGAIVTAARARWYAHLRYPTAWLALAVGALMLRLTSL
jgi:hypothetical protein